MEKRDFFGVFKKYQPSSEKRALLESATATTFRYKKEPMQVEVELTFDRHYPAETLYEIEDECRALYDAASFKIIPHFPASEYGIGRFDEICCEAALCGAVTHGFFSNAEYRDDGECVTVSIPFFDSGVNFVCSSGVEDIMANILESRYGVRRRIKITAGEGASELVRKMEEHRAERLAAAIKENEERVRFERAEAQRKSEEEARLADPHYDFEKKLVCAKNTRCA